MNPILKSKFNPVASYAKSIKSDLNYFKTLNFGTRIKMMRKSIEIIFESSKEDLESPYIL